MQIILSCISYFLSLCFSPSHTYLLIYVLLLYFPCTKRKKDQWINKKQWKRALKKNSYVINILILKRYQNFAILPNWVQKSSITTKLPNYCMSKLLKLKERTPTDRITQAPTNQSLFSHSCFTVTHPATQNPSQLRSWQSISI